MYAHTFRHPPVMITSRNDVNKFSVEGFARTQILTFGSSENQPNRIKL